MIALLFALITTLTISTQDYNNCIDYGVNGKPHKSCTVKQVQKMESAKLDYIKYVDLQNID